MKNRENEWKIGGNIFNESRKSESLTKSFHFSISTFLHPFSHSSLLPYLITAISFPLDTPIGVVDSLLNQVTSVTVTGSRQFFNWNIPFLFNGNFLSSIPFPVSLSLPVTLLPLSSSRPLPFPAPPFHPLSSSLLFPHKRLSHPLPLIKIEKGNEGFKLKSNWKEMDTLSSFSRFPKTTAHHFIPIPSSFPFRFHFIPISFLISFPLHPVYGV